MRLVSALLISALLAAATALCACSPKEKPADVATSAEASALSQMAAANATALSDMPPLASAASSSTEATCLAQIGKAASDRLVQRCIMVSPATHPPCNAQNTCEMIQGEIDRSCAMYGPDEKKPAECAA